MPKKLKEKTWFTLVAPKFFDNKIIGETPAVDEKAMLNRRVEVSAIELTGNYDKYYLKLKFKVNKVEGEKAYTVFDGLECTQDYLSRITRKGTSKIEAIQDHETNDGVKLRVKSVIITNRRVKSSIVKSVRNRVKSIIKEEVENSNLEEFLGKVLSDHITKRVMEEASRIYPLRHFVIRRIDVLRQTSV